MNKEEVIELVNIFGLFVDYDQWEEKGWIRIKSHDSRYQMNKKGCLIIYDDYIREGILELLQNSLVDLGQSIKQMKIREELGV